MTQLMTYRGFSLAKAPGQIKALVTAFLVMAALGVGVGFLNYQVRTGLTAEGSAAWYRQGVAASLPAAGTTPGGEAMWLYAKTPLELLDATHPHLFNQAFLFFVLGHLLALCSISSRWKTTVYLVGYAGVAVDVASPYLIRYGGSGFAWLQLAGHVAMAAAFLVLVVVPLWQMWASGTRRLAGPVVAGLTLLVGCASGGADLEGRVEGPRPEPTAKAESVPEALVRLDRAWPVMGTMLQVTALAGDSASAREAVEEARVAVFRVDSLMSTYRPESELSRLADRAGTGAWTELSAETAAVLEAALGWAERSGGAFDPTVAPLVRAWGFHRGEGRVPPPATIDSLSALVDWRAVEMERGRPPYEAHAQARLPRAGMALDFGAIAKGYALDRALAAMEAAGALGAMADLGGHVSVFGTSPDGGAGWPIGIRDPRDPERLLGRVVVGSGSVATSGDYERFFVHDGVRYSHIIDPRTGWPSEGIAQVTVVAPDGTVADALSTTMFVVGRDDGRALLERYAPQATVVWIADPGKNPVAPADVVVSGAETGRVELEVGPPP